MKKNILIKTSYIGLSAEILHHGHINLINAASKNCKLIVGLINDKALAKYKRLPSIEFKNRKKILENIKGVFKVVTQNNWDYSKNIKKYKPNYFYHGDDWNLDKNNLLKKNALLALKSYGGKLVEIPYTKDILSNELLQNNWKYQATNSRVSFLRRLLNVKKFIRIIETHSPIASLIAENLSIKRKNELKEFDGFWSSSLTDSTFLGKPDNEILNIPERLNMIGNIFEVTSKPLIMDIDTGGKIEHLKIHIKNVENRGVSAVIIEDKKGLKKNSLFGQKVKQYQDTPNNFAKKIKAIKQAQINPDFMCIARIESFILGKGVQDALKRADTYVKSGADGIMIHTSKKDTTQIFNFAKKFRKKYKEIPLIAVPSSYSHVKEQILENNGFNIVIYANQLFRASYPAMLNVAKSILLNERSKESEKKIMNIGQILNLIPGTK